MRMMGHPGGTNFSTKSVSKPPVPFGMKMPSKAAIALTSLLAGCGTPADTQNQGSAVKPNSLTIYINRPDTDTLAFNYANVTCQKAGGKLAMFPVDLGEVSQAFDIFECSPQAGKDRLDMEKLPAPPKEKIKVGILKKLYFAFAKPVQMLNPKKDKEVSF